MAFVAAAPSAPARRVRAGPCAAAAVARRYPTCCARRLRAAFPRTSPPRSTTSTHRPARATRPTRQATKRSAAASPSRGAQPLYASALRHHGASGGSDDDDDYGGSAARAASRNSDARSLSALAAALLAACALAYALPRFFLFATADAFRYAALAVLAYTHGLSLGSYEVARIQRLPLTIGASVLGRLLLMPLVAVCVLALGIQLDPAAGTSLILVAASPSGAAPVYTAALTDTSVRELAALMTLASTAASAFTLPLLVYVLAPTAVVAASLPAFMLAYVGFLTLPFVAGAATSMFVVGSANASAALRKSVRPLSWVAATLLAGGAAASARAVPLSSVSRGVFIAALLISLLGVLLGTTLSRRAGHSRRAQRTMGYEYALPGVAICAALAPTLGGGGSGGVMAVCGYACAATLAAQALVIGLLTPYYNSRAGR